MLAILIFGNKESKVKSVKRMINGEITMFRSTVLQDILNPTMSMLYKSHA